MELAAIFLLLVVLVIVVLFVAGPFIERWHAPGKKDDKLLILLSEQKRILASLQELDFDHSLGKISDEEYPSRRAVLLQRGAELLRQLDTFQSEMRAEAGAGAQFVGLTKSLTDDELGDLLAKRRAQRKENAVGICPKCGKPILRSDRFCPACGQVVK